MADINQRLVNTWREDTVGSDRCNAMTDRLNGILSLESAEETRPLFEALEAQGFDHARVSELIAETCDADAGLAEDLPELPDLPAHEVVEAIESEVSLDED